MTYWFRRYLLATYSYGAISAIPQMWRKERKYINPKTFVGEVLPVPIVERFGTALFKTCIAPVWWPFILYKDLTRLELYCKGVDPRRYGINPDEDLF